MNLPLAALERIWAWTYFYLAVLDLVENLGLGVKIDLTTIPEVQPARNLANWALACEKRSKQTSWPEDLPRPDKEDGSDNQIKRTNDYFYHALCFIVLHEVGHIKCRHLPEFYEDKTASYNCEFAADDWAMDFMLKDCEKAGCGEKAFIGRSTGIALGLAMLCGVEFYHYAAKDDHPTIAERLLRFFERHNPESTGLNATMREFPKYLATAIIHGNFMNAGIPFEPFKSFKDFTSYLIDAHQAMSQLKH